MAIKYITSSRANLSAKVIDEQSGFKTLMREDYLGLGNDSDLLFENDVELQRQVTENADAIAQNADDIQNNANNIAQNASSIADNAADIATNAAAIAQNALDIAQNASDIADINDGRYSPQFGIGSPEGVVTSNRNQTYFDTAVPSMWVNPTIGVNTGWVQIV